MGPVAIIITFVVVIAVFIYILLVRKFNYWKKRGVDGPKPRLFVGNFPSLFNQSRHIAYDLEDIYRAYKHRERFVGIFSATSPQLLILDPKLCKEVLVTNFTKFHDNEFGKLIDKEVDPILAHNPFSLAGSDWKEKRAEISPAFTTSRIKASYPVIQQVCKKLTNYLETETKRAGSNGINGKEVASKFTVEVVANCVYGIEAKAFSDEESTMQKMGSQILNNSFLVVFYAMMVATMPIISKFYKMRMVKEEVTLYFKDLMEKAIALREDTKSDRVDFLNYLLELRKKKNLSNLDMASHTMTFFLDGFDTSSIVIANCLHVLAENPDVQHKLRKELRAAAESGEISYEKLIELPYLDQCMNEAIRIRPPGAFNNKLCTETCEIRTKKDKTIVVEKGTAMVVPYYCFHNDSEYFPNPDKFDPDRFSPENGGTEKYKNMGVFLPFGDGPRICLGMRFGACQTKAIIAEIIRNWQINVNPKTKRNFVMDPKQFFCQPDGGLFLDFKKIEY